MEEKMDLLLKNGLVVTENECKRVDIAVKNGKIAGLLERGSKTCCSEKEIDCQGKVILPGAIDTHSHFFEPGEPSKYRDDFYTATMAAAAGGYTTCIEMPQSIPPVVNKEAFLLKKKLATEKAVVDFALWGGLVPSSLDKIKELKEEGCVAFKAFTSDAGPDYEMCSDYDLLEGMKIVKAVGGLVGIHAENDSICRKMTEYYRGMKTICPEYHEASRPWYAELEAVSRCILWSRITECPVMICHLSIPEGAEQIKKEKEAGNKFIFAETCAHYLLFDTDTLKKYGAFARCNPPLRSPERREKLWEYVLNGTIEVIGSDHAAYTHEEKQAAENIFDAPCGFPGLQTILPGLLTEGVIKRGMSLVDFARLTSTNAAKRFGLYPKKGHIAVGADADFAIISLNYPWKYDHTKSFSKGKSNGYPQENMSFEAKVEKTMVRGEVVYQSEKIVKPKGYGQWLC